MQHKQKKWTILYNTVLHAFCQNWLRAWKIVNAKTTAFGALLEKQSSMKHIWVIFQFKCIKALLQHMTEWFKRTSISKDVRSEIKPGLKTKFSFKTKINWNGS